MGPMLLARVLLLTGLPAIGRTGASAPPVATSGGLEAAADGGTPCERRLKDEEAAALRKVLENLNQSDVQTDAPCGLHGVDCAEVASCELVVVGLRLGFHVDGARALPDELARLPGLQVLELDSGRGLEGTLAPLSGLRELRRLSLAKTGVRGGLEPLGDLVQLVSLSLRETQVSGSLAPLAKLVQLQHLDLGDTMVDGGFAPLAGMPDLETLALERTQVDGNIADLRVTNLTEVYLQATKVHGDITSLRKLLFLRVAMLKRTHVKVTPGIPRYEERDSSFPTLTTLDLSFCPLELDVTKLLQPFFWATHLDFLHAGSAGISGELGSLSAEVEVPTNDGTEHMKSRLRKSLLVLQLPENRLTRADLPSRVLQKLSLRRNPELREASLELMKVSDNIFLDLRFTGLVMEELFADGDGKALWKRDTTRSVRVNATLGYHCYRVYNRQNLYVTQETFAPVALCECLPGYTGTGAECTRCPTGRYKENAGSHKCRPCPSGYVPESSRASCVRRGGIRPFQVLWPALLAILLLAGLVLCLRALHRSGRFSATSTSRETRSSQGSITSEIEMRGHGLHA